MTVVPGSVHKSRRTLKNTWWRVSLPLVLFLGLCAALPRVVSGATVTRVRRVDCWDDARKTTRVTVQVDSNPSWSVQEYDSPPRLLVRIERAQLDKSLGVAEGGKLLVNFNKGVVSKFEAWQTNTNRVYLFVHLNAKCSSNVYLKNNFLCLDFERPTQMQVALEPPEKVRQRKSVLTKFVVIDAGHGGEDPGACGLYGTIEKDIVLNIAKKLVSIMNDPNNKGFHAYLTREADFCPSLEDRVIFANELANRGGADCMVSIHCNWAKNANATGVEIFRLSESEVSQEAIREMDKGVGNTSTKSKYSSETQAFLTRLRVEDADRLARNLLDQLCAIPGFSRRAEDAKQARFRVLRNLHVSGVLVEVGFLSNWSDATKIKNPAVQEQIAWKIYEGLKGYFGVEAVEPLRPKQVASAASTSGLRYHKATKGETLWSIARTYGVSVEELTNMNVLPGRLLKEGQVLIIPSGGGSRTASDSEPIVQSLPKPTAKPLVVPEEAYSVKPGDNLYSISKRYGVSIQQLRTRNNLDKRGVIHPGATLVIPERRNR